MVTHPGRRARIALCLIVIGILVLSAVMMAGAAVWPEASGDKVKKKGGTTLDVSNARDGYVMVKQKAGKKRLKAQMKKGNETYTYDVNNQGDYEVFSLQMGNGEYALNVLEQAKGNQYAYASKQSFSVDGMDKAAPFLCPNQYVWYTADSPAVAKAQELCQGLTADKDKVDAIVGYLSGRFTYDFVNALTIKNTTGYLPDVDQVFDKGTGICFDLSAVMACMLRTQDIPTQLVIGNADSSYHAWNNVLIDGEYVRYDLTAILGGITVKNYTTERIY